VSSTSEQSLIGNLSSGGHPPEAERIKNSRTRGKQTRSPDRENFSNCTERGIDLIRVQEICDLNGRWVRAATHARGMFGTKYETNYLRRGH